MNSNVTKTKTNREQKRRSFRFGLSGLFFLTAEDVHRNLEVIFLFNLASKKKKKKKSTSDLINICLASASSILIYYISKIKDLISADLLYCSSVNFRFTPFSVFIAFIWFSASS